MQSPAWLKEEASSKRILRSSAFCLTKERGLYDLLRGKHIPGNERGNQEYPFKSLSCGFAEHSESHNQIWQFSKSLFSDVLVNRILHECRHVSMENIRNPNLFVLRLPDTYR